MMFKIVEVVFAFLLGMFTIIAVGVWHFIKIFWIYILTATVFTSLFYSRIPQVPLDTCMLLGLGMTVLMVYSLKVFGNK